MKTTGIIPVFAECDDCVFTTEDQSGATYLGRPGMTGDKEFLLLSYQSFKSAFLVKAAPTRRTPDLQNP